MKLTLERIADVPSMGTLSTVYIDGNAFCYAMEQNWMNNQPFVSCVPDGAYELEEFKSNKYGSTFALYSPENNVYANKGDMVNDMVDMLACYIRLTGRMNYKAVSLSDRP
jgi:hypothetical protein